MIGLEMNQIAPDACKFNKSISSWRQLTGAI